MPEKELTLTLPAGAVGLILAALAELPFKVSGQLIANVQAQAAAQLVGPDAQPSADLAQG